MKKEVQEEKEEIKGKGKKRNGSIQKKRNIKKEIEE